MRARPRPLVHLVLAVPVLLGVLCAPMALAADTESVYRTPAPVLVDLVDARLTPGAWVSPDGSWLLVKTWQHLPSIAELSGRELRLAGYRIDPRTSGPSRAWTAADLSLVRVADGAERAISGLPAEAKIGYATWSPDAAHVAFTQTGDDRIELWVVDVATATARRLADAPLDLAARLAPTWLPDSSGLLATLVPPGRGPEPPAPEVPSGPVIQENAGKEAPARTYEDLLETPHDEALFEHYFTAQLARIGLDGTVTPLGAPGLIAGFDPSPSGEYLLVETLHRPFSYLVPASRFPRRVEVWDRRGQLVRRVAELPLAEEIPIAFGSVRTGPREHEWRADAPATLVWAEALDGGDAGAEAAERDRLFTLAAPFDGQPAPLATLDLRYDRVTWGSGDLALVSEWWWPTRTDKVLRLRPDAPGTPPEILFDYSWEDRYHDPGWPVTTTDAHGRRVLRTADGGATFFLSGEGASPEGDRPFLDAYHLGSHESERLFRSQAPYYERPYAVLDPAGPTVLTSRESVEEPANVVLRRLGPAGGEAGSGGAFRQLTAFPNPTPQLAGVQKEQIRYRRADGVDLTATLYLPAGYDAQRDGPLPLLMWAYPLEYKSADAAGQVTDSPYRFVQVDWDSPLLFLARGYAVLDDPSMPIVGEGDAEPNDTYVEQLVASAKAAVDEVVRRGVAERGRIAIGGHSYGAFMVANLLAHSDLFAAGIAQSGAYNRTLTPFGFQAEERTVWQAPEVYYAMSPFLHADQVQAPLLLIHGQADNNAGTFPIQSERFYAALKGLGKTARLVMLPDESHGYRARESVLHVLWEMDRWLETYVKEAPAATPAPGSAHAPAQAAATP